MREVPPPVKLRTPFNGETFNAPPTVRVFVVVAPPDIVSPPVRVPSPIVVEAKSINDEEVALLGKG